MQFKLVDWFLLFNDEFHSISMGKDRSQACHLAKWALLRPTSHGNLASHTSLYMGAFGGFGGVSQPTCLSPLRLWVRSLIRFILMWTRTQSSCEKSTVNALPKVVGFFPGTPVSSHRKSWQGGLWVSPPGLEVKPTLKGHKYLLVYVRYFSS